MTEKEYLEKIDSGVELTEDELRWLVNDYNIEEIFVESHRWQDAMESIVQLEDRFFSISWMAGRTEMQSDEYDDQPIEVFKREYTKTILITEWKSKEGNVIAVNHE